jgi:hypothetical protein
MYWLVDVVPLQKHNHPTKCHISYQTAAAKKVTINSKFVFPQRQDDKETHNTV